ncbi:MAG: pilus assembly protein TadG-related protein [Planctomycetota bacterium]
MPRSQTSSAPRRRGATLLLFALLVFGLMAVAALSIDLGFARLSQAQMQNAVDGAALEGLRWRNTLASGQPDFIEPIPTYTENNRRRRASDHVRLVFDDDMDLTTRDQGAFGTGGRFAAGPDLRVENGLGRSPRARRSTCRSTRRRTIRCSR